MNGLKNPIINYFKAIINYKKNKKIKNYWFKQYINQP